MGSKHTFQNINKLWPDVGTATAYPTDPIAGSYASSIDASSAEPTLLLSNLPNAGAFRPILNKMILQGMFFVNASGSSAYDPDVTVDNPTVASGSVQVSGIPVGKYALIEVGQVVTGPTVGAYTYVTAKQAAGYTVELSRPMGTSSGVHPQGAPLYFSDGAAQRRFSPGRGVRVGGGSGAGSAEESLAHRSTDGRGDALVPYDTTLVFPIQVLFAGMPGYRADGSDTFDYDQAREVKDLVRFATSRMPNFVEKVASTKELAAVQAKAAEWGLPVALVFSKSSGTSSTLKALSTEYRRRLIIAEHKASATSEVAKKFGVTQSADL